MTFQPNKTIVRSLVLLLAGMMVSLCCHSQTVDNRVFKKWLVTDEDGTQILFDLSDGKHLVRSCTYTAEQCKELSGNYQPGVFYLQENYEIRAQREAHSFGIILYKAADGQWTQLCQYNDLTNEGISFVYDEEHTWNAEVTKETFEVQTPPAATE